MTHFEFFDVFSRPLCVKRAHAQWTIKLRTPERQLLQWTTWITLEKTRSHWAFEIAEMGILRLRKLVKLQWLNPAKWCPIKCLMKFGSWIESTQRSPDNSLEIIRLVQLYENYYKDKVLVPVRHEILGINSFVGIDFFGN